MQNISIIGAGWLGLPLALELKELGNNVNASKTTKLGMDELTKLGLPAFVLELSDPHSISVLSQVFIKQQSKVVVACFPPGFRSSPSSSYFKKWQHLISAANKAEIERLIMISTTAVYPEEDRVMVEADANSPARAHSEKALHLLEAEQALINEFNGEFVILRLAGLFGPERDPARFAAKMKSVSDLAPANMLHQADAIAAINFIISKKIKNEVINVTSPETVSKAEFYQLALKRSVNDTSALTLPAISQHRGKRICADKLLNLGYKFKYHTSTDGLGKA